MELTQTAKLWIRVHVRLHDNYDVHLGGCALVSISFPTFIRLTLTFTSVLT